MSATNRVLRALGMSAGLVTAYAVLFGGHLLELARNAEGEGPDVTSGTVRALALWGLGLLFIAPALTALFLFLVARIPRPGWLARFRLSYDPTPRAWDFAFNGVQPTYLRVLTVDGRYVGGWFGENSYATTYPEPREIFIETAHRMTEEGEFEGEVENSDGLYVRCDDIRLLEFVAPPVVSVDDVGDGKGSGGGS